MHQRSSKLLAEPLGQKLCPTPLTTVAEPRLTGGDAAHRGGAGHLGAEPGIWGRSRAFWGGAGLPGGARLRRSMSRTAGGGAARVSAPDTQTDRQTRQTEKVSTVSKSQRERGGRKPPAAPLWQKIFIGAEPASAGGARLRFGGLLGICVLLDLT